MREIEFWKFFFLERGKVRQTASLVRNTDSECIILEPGESWSPETV